MVKCLFEMCGAPRRLICHGGKFLIYYYVKCDEYLQVLGEICCGLDTGQNCSMGQ